MIDYQAIADAGGFGKGPRRDELKRARQFAERAADDKAKRDAWIRCKGRCVRCGKRIELGGKSILTRAEFNHTAQPREGGRKVHEGEYLCYGCHHGGPSGGHRRRAK